MAVIQFELDAELDKERTLNYMSRNKNIIAGNVGAVCFDYTSLVQPYNMNPLTEEQMLGVISSARVFTRP